jgi:hypothetical protein
MPVLWSAAWWDGWFVVELEELSESRSVSVSALGPCLWRSSGILQRVAKVLEDGWRVGLNVLEAPGTPKFTDTVL